MAANCLKQNGNSEVVRMQEQGVRIEPSTLDNRHALARTAIRFMALPTAQKALDERWHPRWHTAQ